MMDRLESLGSLLVRYGLALVLIWTGAMKFTAYEAADHLTARLG